LTPDHKAVPPPATDAFKSNAQSGSLKLTLFAAPALADADSGFQSVVPVRLIEIDDKAASVPLTSVKFVAPANANAGAAEKASAASAKRRLFMTPIYAENRFAPRR
jgi:hypothetical protein